MEMETNKKTKNILPFVGILIAVVVSIIAVFVSYISFFNSNQTGNAIQSNQPKKTDVGGFVKNYEDRSATDPIDTNISNEKSIFASAQENIKRALLSAKQGAIADSAESCGNDGFCVGGYAAKHDDQSLCETYDFESLYHMYPMCDCGITRGKFSGNSKFEDCYTGFGMIAKDEATCLSFPDSNNTKNIPHYEDNKDSAKQIKQDSCLYGIAFGKNNLRSCDITGFFKNACYRNFAELKKMSDFCDAIDNQDLKSRCIAETAPLSGDIEKCGYITPLEEKNGPVVFSNMETAPSEETNLATKNADRCFFDVVDKQKLTDAKLCEEIKSPYYKYLCRQRIALHLKDPSLCTIEFLASQGNIDGCINVLSEELNDVSLCQRSSNSELCIGLFNKTSGTESNWRLP